MLVYTFCQIVELPYTRRRVPSSPPHILTPYLLIDISVAIRILNVASWTLAYEDVMLGPDTHPFYDCLIFSSISESFSLSHLAPCHPIKGSWNPQYLSQAASTTLQTATQLSTFPVQFDILGCATHLCFVKLQLMFPTVRYLTLALQNRCQFVLILPWHEM